MSLRLSVPGKTFLIGEYVALHGGPALLLCTEPRFELRAQPSTTGACRTGLSTAGPVAALLEDSHFRLWDLEFVDPHQGRGGFGGSSGQFLLLFAFLQNLQEQALCERDLLKTYRELARTQGGRSPSGYDLVAQMLGQVSFVHRERDEVVGYNWNFEKLDFLLVRTGVKLPTHEHLGRLDNWTFRDLEGLALRAREALRMGRDETFLGALRGFRDQLIEKGLVGELTMELVPKIEKILGVLLAKGCGAMGADVICVLVEAGRRDLVRAELHDLGLECVGDSGSISNGLTCDVVEGVKVMEKEGPWA